MRIAEGNRTEISKRIEETKRCKQLLDRSDSMRDISILADDFNEGENIPSEYTCDGKNLSPGLFWTWIPTATKSVTLIMDDPDAPGGTFVHWVLYNIPIDIQKLDKGIQKENILKDGTTQGMTSFGSIGYGGPCPPSGVHRYYFRIYALDKTLELPPGVTRSQVDVAMKGHIIASGQLMGRYKKRQK